MNFPLISLMVASAIAVPAVGAPKSATAPASAAVNGLAVRLQQSLRADGNTLISPWSLQSALAMIYAGADAPVAGEMANALSLPPESKELHTAFHDLRAELLATPDGAPPITLHSANRVVMQKGFDIGTDWLAIVKSQYQADAVQVDTDKDSTASVAEINQWVHTQTEGKIPSIIERLDPGTALVLLNAVYMDMVWDERFTKELTSEQPFYLTATDRKTVSLMFKQHRMRYSKQQGYQIAALPYAGGTCQFVVLVPDAVDGLARLEKSLSAELLASCASLPEQEVRLSMPRQKLEFTAPELIKTFQTMGMRRAFNPGGAGGFSRIGPGLEIRQIVHRTYLQLDEDGTKAAAATAIELRAANGHPHAVPHKVVKADRPFLYMIQHVPTGTCIFLGRCIDPASEEQSPSVRKPNSAR
jgi:serpin B